MGISSLSRINKEKKEMLKKKTKLEIVDKLLEAINDNLPKKRWYWYDKPGIKMGLCGIATYIWNYKYGDDYVAVTFLERAYKIIYGITPPQGYWWLYADNRRDWDDQTVEQWYAPRIEFLNMVKEMVEKQEGDKKD